MIQKTTKTILIEYLKNNHAENFVYHITSDYYKQSIIENGLTRNLKVTQEQIDSLETILQNENFQHLNITLNNGYLGNQTIIERIKESYSNVTADEYTVSASFDCLKIFDYLKEETKGGQYLKHIKPLVAEIEKITHLDNNLLVNIDSNLKSLMNFVDAINRSGFLLCKIDKTGIEDTGDEIRFQTTQNIGSECIYEIIEINKLI